ncbi:MAG: hypothetical protein ACRD2U_05260 [Terriglobales bacterium]
MRHGRLLAFIFLLAAALLLSGSAFADSMVFNGPGGNNSGGVYTFPYDFTVNGQSMQLLCDSFDNEIVSGETWKATENSIPGSGRLFDPGLSGNYAAAGLIFDTIVGANGVALSGVTANSSDANWAIWALFSSNALADITPGNASSPFGTAGDPNALAYYNAALAAAVGAPSTDFTGIIVYTPEAGTQSGNHGTPQEFLGLDPMPEPGEFSYLGILALVGAGAFVFRKRFAFERP